MIAKTKLSQKGQALLVVLLMMSVALTVVLSSVSRSITEIDVTEVEEDSQRAFSAAEAGIEKALISTSGNASGTYSGGGSFSASTVTTSNNDDHYLYPNELAAGEVATFWFVGHGTDGSLTCSGQDCARSNRLEVCWGQPGDTSPADTKPAIELTIYVDSSPGNVVGSPNDYSTVDLSKIAFDSNNSRTSQNNFNNSVGSCSFSNLSYSTGRQNYSYYGVDACNPASGVGCLIKAEVKMLYNDDAANPIVHPVAIEINTPATNFALQGNIIESVGSVNDSQRIIQVFKGYPSTPDMFSSALFVNNDITK